MFYMVADHLLNHPKFARYTQDVKDEMRQLATIKCVRNLHYYNPERGTMFNFLTTVCFSSNVTYLGKYYKALNRRRELLILALEQTDANQISRMEHLKQLLKELRADAEEYGRKSGGNGD